MTTYVQDLKVDLASCCFGAKQGKCVDELGPAFAAMVEHTTQTGASLRYVPTARQAGAKVRPVTPSRYLVTSI
jgi:hypothetical protein